jgi:AcrR family transcriptional regulator
MRRTTKLLSLIFPGPMSEHRLMAGGRERPAARPVDAAYVRPGGRTARVRRAVLQATVDELIYTGYAGLRVEAVAARAGVGKATVYRRWGGRDRLLVDAVEHFAVEQTEVPDTGNFDDDLRLWARSIRMLLSGPVSGQLVRAVFGAGSTPEIDELRRRFWSSRAHLVRPLVERALSRREIPTGTDVDEVIRQVGAPLYYRFLVLAEPVTKQAADLAAAAAAAATRAGVFCSTPTATPSSG